MTFLQPWILLALPMIALPVIIHLVNQRRGAFASDGPLQEADPGCDVLRDDRYGLFDERILVVVG
jgi:hypothetical protein